MQGRSGLRRREPALGELAGCLPKVAERRPSAARLADSGGEALADALFGRTNRWGKMPYSVYTADWAKTNSMLDHDVQHGLGRTYRYYRGSVPLVTPFGHGLSYTTFGYGNPQIRMSDSDNGLCVNVRVRNEGKLAGSIMPNMH